MSKQEQELDDLPTNPDDDSEQLQQEERQQKQKKRHRKKHTVNRSRKKNVRKDYHFKLFKTPKEASAAMVVVGENKANYTMLRLIVLGIIAGIAVGIGALCAVSASSIFQVTAPANSTVVYPAGIKKIIFAVTFPVGLLFILLYGGELFTGNVMVMTIGLLGRTVTVWRATLNVVISFFMNILGCCAVAGFLAYFTDQFATDPTLSYIRDVAVAKDSMDWEVAFLKGIGANMMVCLAVFTTLCSEDIASKVIVIYAFISTMVLAGFEHSIANTFLVPVALMYGCDTNLGKFIYKNLIPVTIGNVVGGVLIGGWAYYLYLHQEVIPAKSKSFPLEGGRKLPVRNELVMLYNWIKKKWQARQNNTALSDPDSAV